jgi:hypothetical protein
VADKQSAKQKRTPRMRNPHRRVSQIAALLLFVAAAAVIAAVLLNSLL